MGNFLKKNWFVTLVIVIFTCISVYYIYDTNKGKLQGKSSGGEDVVYTVDNTDVTASQFYDKLYTTSGSNAVMGLFQKTVADASFKTTDDLKDQASTQAENIKSNYASSYGSDYEAKLNSALAATGFDSLDDFCLTKLKLDKVVGEYAANHFDDLKIREISYILIKYDDPNNPSDKPTEGEQEKMDGVDKMLKDGKSFADAAKKYSEDTSTSTNGGVLGVIDKNTNSLDEAFTKASLDLKEGEVSDWVKSDNFGYFKIMCNAATPEKLESSKNIQNPYETLVTTYDTTLSSKAIWEKAESLGIDFKGNDDLEKEIKAAFGVEDDKDAPKASAKPEASATPEASADSKEGK